jgi:hypothetical protein
VLSSSSLLLRSKKEKNEQGHTRTADKYAVSFGNLAQLSYIMQTGNTDCMSRFSIKLKSYTQLSPTEKVKHVYGNDTHFHCF